MTATSLGLLRGLQMMLVLLAAGVTASANDLSGTWNVDGSVQGHPVTYTCTLEQDGEALSGTVHLPDTDLPLTGAVQGTTVTWMFEVHHEGTPLEMEFAGTLASDAEIRGTIWVAGTDGDFTATRQE